MAVAVAVAAGCQRRPGRGNARAEGAPPPAEVATLRARGEALFFGRAGCVACHKLGDRGDKVRGPNLGADKPGDPVVAQRAATRRPGLSPIEYIVESLVDPDAVIVPGYARGVMVRADEPPVSLTDDDLVALAVLLCDGGPSPGHDLDAEALLAARARVPLARKARAARAAASRADAVLARVPWDSADLVRGQAVLARMACAGCHGDPTRAKLGAPPLEDIARRLSRQQIARWVIAPPTDKMPSYAASISVQELADLTAVLAPQPATPSTNLTP
ncbi:MAG: c-type cytochrome [Deltaproteobacteria bacterium]|nr:c-type cytochrome [Deltaproteobacteria bacterium]